MNDKTAQNGTPDTASESTPKTPFVQKVGRWVRTELAENITVPFGFVLLFAVVLLIAGMVIGALAINNEAEKPQAAPTTINNTTINNTTTQAAPTTVQAPAPVSKPEPALIAEPFMVVGGKDYTSTGGGKYGMTYACESSLTPVRIWPGQTVQRDGVMLSLEKNAVWQRSGLTLTVKLDDATALPGLIVNPAAHTSRPDLWNQASEKLDMPFGYEGSRSFMYSDYNPGLYYADDITNLTVCLQKK